MNANENHLTDQVPENSASPIKQNSPDEEIARDLILDIENYLSNNSLIFAEFGALDREKITRKALAALRRVKAGQEEIIRLAIKQIKACMCAGSDGHRLNLKIADQLREIIRGVAGQEEEERKGKLREITPASVQEAEQAIERILGKPGAGLATTHVRQNAADELFGCLFCDAVHNLGRDIEVIAQEGRCSVSLLQRRCRYGFAHALEVCNQLEAKGYIKGVHSGWELTEKAILSSQGVGDHAAGVSSEGWWNCQAHGHTDIECTCGAATAFVTTEPRDAAFGGSGIRVIPSPQVEQVSAVQGQKDSGIKEP